MKVKLNVSETYGINSYGGVQNSPYSTPPAQSSAPNAARYAGQKHLLEKVPAKDTFTLQKNSNPAHVIETPLKHIKDGLLVKYMPEILIAKYSNKEFLEKAAAKNPNIEKLLQQQGLGVRIEPANVTSIAKSHLIPTKNYAQLVLQESGINYTQKDLQNLLTAALLHDLGKAFIPSEILNKKAALTEKEQKIIKLHNDLGYEVLKVANFPNEVLELVKNHHSHKGGPDESEFTQILKIADIYSALKEERPYKECLSDEAAFKILEQDSERGKFDIHLVNALKNSLEAAQSA